MFTVKKDGTLNNVRTISFHNKHFAKESAHVVKALQKKEESKKAKNKPLASEQVFRVVFTLPKK